jgi:ERCC4-type nuclease
MIDQKLTIIADDREHNIITKLQQLGADVIIKHLNVGDFVITTDHAYERKARGDFVSSITDGRCEEEFPRLAATYKKPKLILEDFEITTGINVKSVYGMLSKINGDVENGGYAIPIVSTIGIGGTAEYLMAECRRLQKSPEIKLLQRDKPKFNTLRDLQLFFLQGLDNVGSEKAQILLDEFKTPWNVLCEIVKVGIRWTDSKHPKFMTDTCLKNIGGFGPQFIINNRKMLGVD